MTDSELINEMLSECYDLANRRDALDYAVRTIRQDGDGHRVLDIAAQYLRWLTGETHPDTDRLRKTYMDFDDERRAMAQALDVALHGRTVARDASPYEVWTSLLDEVARLAEQGKESA